VKEAGYTVKGVVGRKMGVHVVCSVVRLSCGMFSQLVLSLSGERHGVKEKRYM